MPLRSSRLKAHLGLKAPHAPYAFPERLTHAFDGVEIPKPGSFDEDYEATGKRGLVGTGIDARTFRDAIPRFGSWDEYSKSYYRAALSIDDLPTFLRDLSDGDIHITTKLALQFNWYSICR